MSSRSLALYSTVLASLIASQSRAFAGSCYDPKAEERAYENAQSACEQYFGRNSYRFEIRTACNLGVTQVYFVASEDNCDLQAAAKKSYDYCNSIKGEPQSFACKRGALTYLKILKGQK